MYCIRDACLKGKYHCEIYDKYLSKDVPLDILTARYIIGEIILSDEYKKKIYNNNKDRYKQTIIKQVDRLLRQKFMPCVYKDESIDDFNEFYDILKKNGIDVTVRRKFGNKISAACGQLRSKEV